MKILDLRNIGVLPWQVYCRVYCKKKVETTGQANDSINLRNSVPNTVEHENVTARFIVIFSFA